MARLLILALLVAGLLAAGATAAPVEVRTEGSRFVDRDGREVILRGGAIIKKFGSGLPVVTDADWANLEALGWNSIRLGTAWEFIEPARGDYDEAYLDAFAALAREATSRGLQVVVDMHQDVWGRPAGNGAPGWATDPRCAGTHVNLAGATGTFAANYFSPFTVCQFTSFWGDTALQDRYAAALAQVAARLAGEPALIGYDLMNEPFQGAHPPAEFEARALYPFYDRVTAALHAVDPDANVFLEPANAKNVHLPTASGLGAGALPRSAAYAPHVYGLWDANDAFTERSALVAANMEFSAQEARVLGVPLWYGEFGLRRTAPRAEDTVAQIYELADEQLAGASVWEYARNDYGLLRADGSLDPARATTVARPYPERTAGTLHRFAYDRASRTFELAWRSSGTTTPTLVRLPSVTFGAGAEIEATSGVTVRRLAGGTVLELEAAAGEHTLRAVARSG